MAVLIWVLADLSVSVAVPAPGVKYVFIVEVEPSVPDPEFLVQLRKWFPFESVTVML